MNGIYSICITAKLKVREIENGFHIKNYGFQDDL